MRFESMFSRLPSGLNLLTKAEYDQDLRDPSRPTVSKRAFEKAWEARNFEIELYWKRTTYFWPLIATTFAGYFALAHGVDPTVSDKYQHVELYFVICIGFTLSVAWLLINKGSKAWQRHWEVHIDLLEDRFTGPLYKTVHPGKTYSVSKINEIVCMTVIGFWSLLGIKYLVVFDLLNVRQFYINWFVVASSLGTLLLVASMFFWYGRGRFSVRHVTMSRRSIVYRDPDQP